MLLERESPLASLSEYALDAQRGDGRLVLVSGEAGGGKSALIERLAADLPDARWSWGACDGLFTPRPLGPLLDVADQLGGDLLDLCRAHAPRDDLFSALLRRINEPEILDVVVFEDMHWADEATVDLLRYLGRRLRAATVLLIASYRDDVPAATDPLRIAVGELSTQRWTRRIGLAPLSAAATAKLAEGSGLDAAELFELTSGNPFYVTEVLSSGTETVPPSARDAVLARGARLSEEARAVLDTAALTGTRVEVRLLESITSCSSDVLDELLGTGLLSCDGDSLRFRHQIARLAVEQAVPAHRRPDAHARILAALTRSGCDDVARLAFHAEAAGNTTATLSHAVAAARHSAAVGSHREAAAQYERALRWGAALDDATLADLYERYAAEASLVDRWQDAADAADRALALWRACGDRLREGDLLRQLSRVMWRLCRSTDALAAATQAVAVLEPLGESPELAWAYANLANHGMQDRTMAEAAGLCQRAQAIAERLELPDVLSDATNTLSMLHANAGEDWTEDLHRALEIAMVHDLPPQVGRAYSNLYATYCVQRRFAEAERFYTDGFAYCDEHDMDTYTTCLRGELTSTYEKIGQWSEAVAIGTELLRRVASPINRLNPLITLGTVGARRGDAGSWAHLDEARSGAIGSGEPEWLVAVGVARIEAYWLEGRDCEALAEAETLANDDSRLEPWERGPVAVWLWRLGSGQPIEGAVPEPYRWMIDGEWARAAQRWTELGCAYDAALAQLFSADEAAMRAALRTFESLGAVASARLARQLMRRTGMTSIPAGSRSTTRSHPAGLTRREHEVLDLICAGLTNVEIGVKLFISAKTVDHHVSAVLAKLGVPTRAAAAAEAARLGLVATDWPGRN